MPDPADEMVANDVTHVLDNFEELYHRVTAAVEKALEEHGRGADPTQDHYSEWEYAEIAGSAVWNLLDEHFTQNVTDKFTDLLIRQLLNFGNNDTWRMVGEHFLGMVERPEADEDEDEAP